MSGGAVSLQHDVSKSLRTWTATSWPLSLELLWWPHMRCHAITLQFVILKILSLALHLPLSGSTACIKSAQQKQDSGGQRQEEGKGSAGGYLNKQPEQLAAKLCPAGQLRLLKVSLNLF